MMDFDQREKSKRKIEIFKQKLTGCNCNFTLSNNNCNFISDIIQIIAKITKKAKKTIEKKYLEQMKNSKKLIKTNLIKKPQSKFCECCKKRPGNSIKSLKPKSKHLEISGFNEDYEKIEFMTNYENYLNSQSSMKIIKKTSNKNLNSSFAETSSLSIKRTKSLFSRNEKIIIADLNRTFKNLDYFNNSEIIFELKQLMYFVSNISQNTDYVQGMNFWCAGLVYHCKDFTINKQIAKYMYFYLQLDKIYCFQKMDCFVDLIKYYIIKKIPKIFILFQDDILDLKFFFVNWFFSLGFNIVPIEISDRLISGFIKHGWYFFFKLILSYLKHFENHFSNELNSELSEKDLIKLQIALKSFHKNHYICWDKIFTQLKKIDFNLSFFKKKINWNFADYFTSPRSYF
jgi:hypothetical protein